jgi:hypothetical protein
MHAFHVLIVPAGEAYKQYEDKTNARNLCRSVMTAPEDNHNAPQTHHSSFTCYIDIAILNAS